jgi:hypothetical protein
VEQLELPVPKFGVPPNLNIMAAPNPSIALPYSSDYFHHIIASGLSQTLRSTEWPTVISDLHRTLIANTGVLEISVIDPMPLNAGPRMQSWVSQRILLGMEAQFRATRLSLLVPMWLEQAGFNINAADSYNRQSSFSTSGTNQRGSVEIERTTFPAGEPHLGGDDDVLPPILNSPISASNMGSTRGRSRRASNTSASVANAAVTAAAISAGSKSVDDLRSLAGWTLYQDIYSPFLAAKKELPMGIRRRGGSWWWDDPFIAEECKQYGTALEMVTFRCRKGSAAIW